MSKAGNKMKATWEIINREKGKTHSYSLPEEISHEGVVISDQRNIANLFNKYSLLNSAWPMHGTNNNSVQLNITNCMELYDFPRWRQMLSLRWKTH
jgi:hypothetical protein